jgi:hypothetical protein
MQSTIVLAPLLALPVLWAAAAVAAVFIAVALWRGLTGWWLRGFALAVLLVALANPSLQTEDREALSDIVIAVVDESASQRIADRAEQTAEALAAIERGVARLPNTELRVVRVGDGEGDGGSLVMGALTEAMAQEPRARIAGAILVTDGQVHDMDRAPELPAPLHALLTGREGDWDRRLIVRNAPAFAIIGEPGDADAAGRGPGRGAGGRCGARAAQHHRGRGGAAGVPRARGRGSGAARDAARTAGST